MKRRTILLFVIFAAVITYAISHKQQATIGNAFGWGNDDSYPLVDLHIPDEVTTHESSIRVPIPTTGVSLVVPDGYRQMVNFKGFRRDADTSIDVIEDHQIGFIEKKKEVDTYMAYLKKDKGNGDESVLYRKDFKFNGYDAVVICVSDTKRTRSAIYMTFGDEHFSVAMTGTMSDDKEETRKEIISTMLTAYYQKA